jgi:hypothetical protein
MLRFEYCIIKDLNGISIDNSLTNLVLPNGKYVKLKGNLIDILNDLGKDGWEMVGLINTTTLDYNTIYFKREIKK